VDRVSEQSVNLAGLKQWRPRKIPTELDDRDKRIAELEGILKEFSRRMDMYTEPEHKPEHISEIGVELAELNSLISQLREAMVECENKFRAVLRLPARTEEAYSLGIARHKVKPVSVHATSSHVLEVRFSDEDTKRLVDKFWGTQRR